MLQKGLRRFEQTLMHETCGPHTPSVRYQPSLLTSTAANSSGTSCIRSKLRLRNSIRQGGVVAGERIPRRRSALRRQRQPPRHSSKGGKPSARRGAFLCNCVDPKLRQASRKARPKSYEKPAWYGGLVSPGPKRRAGWARICATSLKIKGLWVNAYPGATGAT
jgi:hypothetical protein